MRINIMINSISSYVSSQGANVIDRAKNVAKINFSDIEKLYGINPEQIKTFTFMRDEKLVNVGDLLKLPIDLSESNFEGSPSILITFRNAMEFVVDYINKKSEKFTRFPILVHKGIEGEIMTALSNIETERPDLIGSDSNCDFWLGAILTILQNKGHIEYQRSAGQYLLYIR
jgi:hypothetical protein